MKLAKGLLPVLGSSVATSSGGTSLTAEEN